MAFMDVVACRPVQQETWRAPTCDGESVVSALSERKQSINVTVMLWMIAYASQALSVVAPSVVCSVASDSMLERSTAPVLGIVTLALCAYIIVDTYAMFLRGFFLSFIGILGDVQVIVTLARDSVYTGLDVSS